MRMNSNTQILRDWDTPGLDRSGREETGWAIVIKKLNQQSNNR